MADIVPKYDELFSTAITALKELGGSGTNREIYEKITEIENFPDEVLDVLHHEGPMTQLEYRLRWTQSYLKKDGMLSNTSRGVWALTPRGRGATEQDINQVKERVKKIYKKQRKTRESDVSDDNITGDVIDELEWNLKLLDTLKRMDPSAFERLSQRILRESGFVKVQVTGKPNDGGIDGIGVLRMNLVSFQVMFQCKRYKGTVSSSAIRDFRGAMTGRADKGLVITTGNFSAEAQREAVRDGAPTIDLIDGDDLCELLKKLKLGVKVELVEEVTVHPEFFATF